MQLNSNSNSVIGIVIEIGGIENGIGIENPGIGIGIENWNWIFLQLLKQQLLVNQPFPTFSFNRGGHNHSCDLTHQHQPHAEDAVTPTNSLRQVDPPASQANPTGTRRGDSVITDIIMTFLRRVSAGQKRQPNNKVGTAAVHPDDELPTERRTHEKI